MSNYLPIVIGEAGSLRSNVEGQLGREPGTVEARLDELDQAAKALGTCATFGAEVEFQFVLNPLADPDEATFRTKEQLYQAVVTEVQGETHFDDYDRDRWWHKGDVIMPEANPRPLMLNYSANGDQVDSEIIELRTAPAEALEANERYWQIIDAVGKVAARYGYMGMILATHINAAVRDMDYFSFTDFHDETNGPLLAAIQHNLIALNPLQIDAGLERNLTVLEAYPHTKDATTTIHENRLEFRHPSVGIADPRVDMLAVLDAAIQARTDAVPKAAQSRLSELKGFQTYTESYELQTFLSRLAGWDAKEKRFVMPTSISAHARDTYETYEHDLLISRLTRGTLSDAYADGGQILREAIGALRIRDGKFDVDKHSPYADKLLQLLGDNSTVSISPEAGISRVRPHVLIDSPETHLERRRNLGRSSVVRRILGGARITPAEEAVRSRQKLIENQMIILNGDELDDLAA